MFWHAVVAVACGFLVACGKSEATAPIVPEQPCVERPDCAVVILPQAVAVNAGGTFQAVAITTPTATPNARWDWTSSDSVRVSVDSTGLVRALLSPNPGTKICATLRSYATLKGCLTIVIQAW